MVPWSMCRTAVASARARCWVQPICLCTRASWTPSRISRRRNNRQPPTLIRFAGPTAAAISPGGNPCCFKAKEKGPTGVGPRRSCVRPDPDDPGGLGAEESETERTEPTQCNLISIQQGGRLAEVGRYYDS